jgi:hypothetical protein
MQPNNPTSAPASNEKRNLGFVKLRRGLREHLHRSRMSSNGSTLFVWLLLSAYHSGPKRGCVGANIEDLMFGLGWSRSMVKRSLEELASKGYISFDGAANQHELGVIRILKFDVEERDSARFTGEPSKNSDTSAELSARLNAQSASEPSTEPSNPSNLQSQCDLQVPKNALEVKNKKNEKRNAVRRPFDAELRASSKGFFSSSEKRKKLLANVAAKIREQDDSFGSYIEICKKKGYDHPFGRDERKAFEALRYKPDLQSPLLSFDFVMAAVEVCEANEEKGVLPGNLCSKLIDYCDTERKKNGGHYYPPDFLTHRNLLRTSERAVEQRTPTSMEVRT